MYCLLIDTYFHPSKADDPMKTRCITVFNKGNLIFKMLHPKEWMSDVCSAFVMVQMAMNMMGGSILVYPSQN